MYRISQKYCSDYVCDSINDVMTYLDGKVSEDFYDECLDECYEEINICGYEYSPSLALYRVDEIAYRTGYADWCDSILSDLRYELETAGAVREFDFYDFTISIEDDEESEED